MDTTTPTSAKKGHLNPLNTFQSELYQYITLYHPFMLNNEGLSDFIVNRSDAAKETYIKAIKNNKNEIEASEEANKVLFANLEFSPTEFIKEYVNYTFSIEIDTDKSLEIYNGISDIFSPFLGLDDIEGTQVEQTLYDKMDLHIDDIMKHLR